jgi:hypothetical protein
MSLDELYRAFACSYNHRLAATKKMTLLSFK